MTQLVDDISVFPVHDICVDADLSQLHPNNRLLYDNWLHQLVRGKTWFGLNYDWPSHFVLPPRAVPEGYDTYVVSWHLEPWDFDWIDNFCKSHPNQQLVIIGEFDYQPLHDNCKSLTYHCWHLFVPYVLSTFGQSHYFRPTRKYKLSSLVNKPSFTKALVSSFLHKYYSQNHNLLMSWNINAKGEFCKSLDFLDTLHSRPILYEFATHYSATMKDLQITLDQFKDVPNLHCNFDHCAYNDCLINLTNETYVQSQKNDQIFPGPYFSEKTWKPLLAGTALLPLGQPNAYQYLENFGFHFEYPWSTDFDKIVGDLDRIEQLLEILKWIFDTDEVLDHKKAILENNKFNYDHIRSATFLNTVTQKNQKSLENFFSSY